MTQDPFGRGRFPVGVATIPVPDVARGRVFTAEVWYPAAGEDAAASSAVRDATARSGAHPLVLFSHYSGGHRLSATYLCTHLASHGYVVGTLDHSDSVTEDPAPSPSRTPAERQARAAAWVASRVPEVRLLLDRLLADGSGAGAAVDPARIGIAGHSFGGWTALATPDVEPRIRSVVALAPGGSSRPPPGIIRAPLRFAWGRDVPTLYLVADRDTSLSLDGMVELYGRTPATRQMVILRRADHLHFVDDVERAHEAFRAMTLPDEAAWIAKAMPPIAELCTGEQAHTFVRGLALCHFDATLNGDPAARHLLAGDVEALLAEHGVAATLYRP